MIQVSPHRWSLGPLNCRDWHPCSGAPSNIDTHNPGASGRTPGSLKPPSLHVLIILLVILRGSSFPDPAPRILQPPDPQLPVPGLIDLQSVPEPSFTHKPTKTSKRLLLDFCGSFCSRHSLEQTSFTPNAVGFL